MISYFLSRGMSSLARCSPSEKPASSLLLCYKTIFSAAMESIEEWYSYICIQEDETTFLLASLWLRKVPSSLAPSFAEKWDRNDDRELPRT